VRFFRPCKTTVFNLDIALKTMPTQLNLLKRLASHRLHGIPEECLYLTNLNHYIRLVKTSLERWALELIYKENL
jgi:hypothetical protein